jgi:hypothetical protein
MTFILTFVEIRFAQICEDPGFQARPQPFFGLDPDYSPSVLTRFRMTYAGDRAPRLARKVGSGSGKRRNRIKYPARPGLD